MEYTKGFKFRIYPNAEQQKNNKSDIEMCTLCV